MSEKRTVIQASSRYGDAALERVAYGLRRHGSTPVAEHLAAASYRIGQLVAGGEIEPNHGCTVLLAAIRFQMSKERAKLIIADAFERAANKPRTAPRKKDSTGSRA